MDFSWIVKDNQLLSSWTFEERFGAGIPLPDLAIGTGDALSWDFLFVTDGIVYTSSGDVTGGELVDTVDLRDEETNAAYEVLQRVRCKRPVVIVHGRDSMELIVIEDDNKYSTVRMGSVDTPIYSGVFCKEDRWFST